MAETSPEEGSNPVSELQDVSKEKENEYIKLVSKKIRTLNKKLNISIANIEKKLASGSKINEDEQKVLNNKPNILRSLKEFEELRSQMLKVQNQEEKDLQKRTKRRGETETKREEKNELQALVELFHVVDFFDKKSVDGVELRKEFLLYQDKLRSQEGKETLINSENDIETFFHLANLINKKSTPQGLVAAVDHATKLGTLSDEEIAGGKAYKYIRQQLAEVVSSPVFAGNYVKVAPPQEIDNKETANKETADVPAESNHKEQENVDEGGEQTEDQGEQVADEEPGDKKDQNKRGYKRFRQGRGRGNFGNQTEGHVSPRESNYNRENRRGGRGNRRGGNRNLPSRGGNSTKSTPPPS